MALFVAADGEAAAEAICGGTAEDDPGEMDTILGTATPASEFNAPNVL